MTPGMIGPPKLSAAQQKQKAVLAKMMGKMRTQSNEKVKEVEDKHAEEIAALKARLEQLEKK